MHQQDKYSHWLDFDIQGQTGIPSAIDYDGSIAAAAGLTSMPGFLIPAWLFAAGDQATFAAQFAGVVLTAYEQIYDKVSILTYGGSFEMLLEEPKQYHFHTWFTLADDTVRGCLHPFKVKEATGAANGRGIPDDGIGFLKSCQCRDTVEINIEANTIYNGMGGEIPTP